MEKLKKFKNDYAIDLGFDDWEDYVSSDELESKLNGIDEDKATELIYDELTIAYSNYVLENNAKEMVKSANLYVDWIELRNKSIDEHGEKLCYCGHTHKCDCGDPDFLTFVGSVERRAIKIGDIENGWKDMENDTNSNAPITTGIGMYDEILKGGIDSGDIGLVLSKIISENR